MGRLESDVQVPAVLVVQQLRRARLMTKGLGQDRQYSAAPISAGLLLVLSLPGLQGGQSKEGPISHSWVKPKELIPLVGVGG